MAKRKRRVRKHVIADLSRNHVEYQLLKAGHTMVVDPADYGYDGSITTFDANGEIENGYAFIQLKATDHLGKLKIQRPSRAGRSPCIWIQPMCLTPTRQHNGAMINWRYSGKLLEKSVMAKLIKTKNLIRVLANLGFEQSSRGSHGIFRERKSGVIVTLPLTRTDLPPVYSRAVLGQVISSGLISEEELNKLLISS